MTQTLKTFKDSFQMKMALRKRKKISQNQNFKGTHIQ